MTDIVDNQTRFRMMSGILHKRRHAIEVAYSRGKHVAVLIQQRLQSIQRGGGLGYDCRPLTQNRCEPAAIIRVDRSETELLRSPSRGPSVLGVWGNN